MSTPVEERGQFHAKHGWRFSRGPDGTVVISHETLDVATMVFDPDTWASAVAFVSAQGENAETFAAASALHSDQPMPEPTPNSEKDVDVDQTAELTLRVHEGVRYTCLNWTLDCGPEPGTYRLSNSDPNKTLDRDDIRALAAVAAGASSWIPSS